MTLEHSPPYASTPGEHGTGIGGETRGTAPLPLQVELGAVSVQSGPSVRPKSRTVQSRCSDEPVDSYPGLNGGLFDKQKQSQMFTSDIDSINTMSNILRPIPAVKSEILPNAAMLEDQLTMLVSIQSLLGQFAHTQVRADFINSRFGCNINPSLLPRMDDLRWTIFPRWQGNGFESATSRSSIASHHIIKLLNRNPSLFIPTDSAEEDCLTYNEWMTALETIAADRYWSRVPCEDRCIHSLTSDNSAASVSSAMTNSANKPAKRIETRKNKGKFSKITEKSSSKASLTKRQKKNKSKTLKVASKVEEILLTSSDQASTDDSSAEQGSAPDSCGDSSDGSGNNMPEPRYHRQHQRRDRREAVTPPVFEINGKDHLKHFLATYETYFSKKYSGTTYDQTQTLAQFLNGDLLKVYNARGGRRLSYEEMKTELLQYYRKQRIGGRSYWRKEFSQAIPNEGEDCDIFGMRLTDLAEKAYPDDKKECALQLRTRFLSVVPSNVAVKVKDAERTIKVTTDGHKRHIPFSAIVQLAKELQIEYKTKAVMWTAPPMQQHQFVERRQSHQPQDHNEARFQPREFYSKRSQYPHMPPRYREQSLDSQSIGPRTEFRRQSLDGEMFCTYCKRPNHTKEECWRRANSCLICGHAHFIESCPRYDPQYQRRNDSRQQLN